MSRLEDAETRLHNAIARLEEAIQLCIANEQAQFKKNSVLQREIIKHQENSVVLDERMKTAALSIDAIIARLREALSK